MTPLAWLSKTFINRDDAFWGIVIDPVEETAHFSAVGMPWICTGYALTIQTMLNRVEVYGFYGADNPTCRSFGPRSGALADGHDFAVVHGRWIVDPWIADAERVGSGVYDLCDPSRINAAIIERHYGQRSCWTKL